MDGLQIIDVGNSHVKPVRYPRTSILDIPRVPPRLYDFQRIPHGTVHRHSYFAKELGIVRSIEVYTPPCYERSRYRYPTLYLLPGSGDTEATWVAHGKVHWILDGLIAQKRAVPMTVVMIDGEGGSVHGIRTKGNLNTEAVRRDLVNEVLPLVESSYRVKKSASQRGIFGISRGGGQSLMIGLKQSDKFAWIGALSSALIEHKSIVASALANSVEINRHVKLLWFACGHEEAFVLDMNRKFDESLKTADVRHEFVVVNGSHGWSMWRNEVPRFLARLFQ